MKTISLFLILVFACLLCWGCASAPDEQAHPRAATEPDWPEVITYRRLDMASMDIRQHYLRERSAALLQRLADPEQTRSRVYLIEASVAAGSEGTAVYYVVEDNQFYLRGHSWELAEAIGFVGPFDGDPRIVLDAYPKNPDGSPAEPDPYVGVYTAYHLPPGPPVSDLLALHERHDYKHSIAIVRQGDHYLVNIEPGVKFYPDIRGWLMPEPESEGVDVMWITPQPPRFEMLDIDGLNVQNGRFSIGYLLLLGHGPATFGQTDPVTGESRVKEWDYNRDSVETTHSWDAVIGRLTYTGKPVIDGIDGLARDRPSRPGDIIITPIGKFMYFREPQEAPNERRISGWINVDLKGQTLFKEDGSLTQAGRQHRHDLRHRYWGVGDSDD